MQEKRMHILAIINPVSGTSNKDKIPRLIDTVVDPDRHEVSIMAETNTALPSPKNPTFISFFLISCSFCK